MKKNIFYLYNEKKNRSEEDGDGDIKNIKLNAFYFIFFVNSFNTFRVCWSMSFLPKYYLFPSYY